MAYRDDRIESHVRQQGMSDLFTERATTRGILKSESRQPFRNGTPRFGALESRCQPGRMLGSCQQRQLEDLPQLALATLTHHGHLPESAANFSFA